MSESDSVPVNDGDVILSLENPARYSAGGYHPVQIGDELHNRYRIIHCLGHGGFSIVWLALDKRGENTQRYVAVKIVTANSKSQEGQILRHLRGSPPFSGWLSYFFLSSSKYQKCGFIPELFDEFDIHGPNGTHHCLVMELLGPSVSDVKLCPEIERLRLLPISTARDVAVQCAKAITSLHSRGVVHGDFHIKNLVFQITADIQSWTVEEVYAAIGKPIEVPISRALEFHGLKTPRDGRQPKYLVSPPPVARMWDLCGPAPSIRLIDFSEAFHSPFKPDRQSLPGTPREFAAPELLLGFASEVTMAIDIWALGCVTFQLFAESNPFSDIYGSHPYYVANIIKVLGTNAVPERFRDAICEMVAGNITEDGIDHCEPIWDEPFDYLRGDPEDDPELLLKKDKEILKKVLSATLVIDPTGRKPAATILGMIQNAWEVGITA